MEVRLEMVRRMFEDVLSGKISREEADRWAYSVMRSDELGDLTFTPSRDRERIWAGVMYLHGVDLMVAPGQYLHCDDDIRSAMSAKLDER